MQARRLTEAGLQLVLGEMARTGFFGTSADFNGAQAMVADANATVFTLHADDREVQVSVYALGLLSGSDPPSTMGAREREAHRVLAPLATKLESLDYWIPESAWAEIAWHPYRSDALRLLVRNADGDPADPSRDRRWAGAMAGRRRPGDVRRPVPADRRGALRGRERQRCRGVVRGARGGQPADPVHGRRPSLPGAGASGARRRGAALPGGRRRLIAPVSAAPRWVRRWRRIGTMCAVPPSARLSVRAC